MADDDNDQDFTPPATTSRSSRVSHLLRYRVSDIVIGVNHLFRYSVSDIVKGMNHLFRARVVDPIVIIIYLGLVNSPKRASYIILNSI